MNLRVVSEISTARLPLHNPLAYVIGMTSDALTALLGKPTLCTFEKRQQQTLLFDWAALKAKDAFINSVFGDCETGDFADVLTWPSKPGGARVFAPTAWSGSPTWTGKAVPFALVGVDKSDLKPWKSGSSYPQFGELLLAELPNGPVFAISVSGTAVPAKKCKRVAANVAALKLTLMPVEAKAKAKSAIAAPAIAEAVALKQPATTMDLLRRLAGHKCPSWLSSTRGPKQTAKPPSDRDVAWPPLLGASLQASVGTKNNGLAAEIAGTLTTFDQASVGEFVKALKAVTPKVAAAKGFIYGYDALFDGLRKLKSNAGVPYALAYLQCGPKKGNFGPALTAAEYVNSFADAAAAPKRKRLLKLWANDPHISKQLAV